MKLGVQSGRTVPINRREGHVPVRIAPKEFTSIATWRLARNHLLALLRIGRASCCGLLRIIPSDTSRVT